MLVGFCLVKEALNPEQLQRVRQRTLEQAAAELVAGVAWIDGAKPSGPNPGGDPGPNQRMFNLTNKGREYRDIVEHSTNTVEKGPLIEALCTELLGNDYLLSSFTSNIAGNGGAQMALHQDQSMVPMPHPPVVTT